MEGDFVQVIKDEVCGKTAVPPPSLNPTLIRDLHVKFPLGKATVPEENVAKQISAWTIPQTLKKQFVATMEEVAHSASVEYKAFFLRLDVPSGDAVYGVLVGVGRKFNGSHVQIGYALASATGTLIQQKERVGYSCCKQHVLGICVDHTTCHKEVDRGDTAAEVQAVAATLEGCLKHQVQHLSYWLDPADYKACSNNLTCQVAPEVKGCGSGISRAKDAVSPQDLLQSLWDDQSLQESLHDKSPGLRDWKQVYSNVEGLVGSSKFAGIPVGQVTSFARGFFHLSDSAVLPFQIFEEESRPGSALVFDRLQLVATDTDQDMTYEAALVLRCTGESFNIWTLLFEQKLNQTLPPGSFGMLEEWRSVRRSHGSFRSLDHHTNDRLHNISHPLDIKTMNISMNMFLMLAVKAVAREENVPLAPALCCCRLLGLELSSHIKGLGGALSAILKKLWGASQEPWKRSLVFLAKNPPPSWSRRRRAWVSITMTRTSRMFHCVALKTSMRQSSWSDSSGMTCCGGFTEMRTNLQHFCWASRDPMRRTGPRTNSTSKT